MAPRIVLTALAIAFAFAAVAATVTTVRQYNRQAWHSADGQSHAAIGSNHSSLDNDPS
jgi:multisubunit Na+/H+ antiporter MnhC subunit